MLKNIKWGSLLLGLALVSCQKYLDVKPNKADLIPATLQDALALLDHTQAMNTGVPGAGEIASDNLYVTTADWNALRDATDRNAYIWGADVFNDFDNNDWSLPYQTILYANTALEILDALPDQEDKAVQQARGAALFYRAWSFYGLAQEFCPPYDEATATAGLGLPLRLTAQVAEPLSRATVQQTYDRILADLSEAAALLPTTALYKTKPAKPAAYALLSRTWLSMRAYDKAGRYADSCLQLYSTLLDYNTLNAALPNPLPQFNAEVLFYAWHFDRTILLPPVGRIDTLLYRSYEAADLRRSLFFQPNDNGDVSFRGSYTGSGISFAGIATDEVFLTRAECRARSGDVTGALKDLNTLLQYRYQKGMFVPLTAATPLEALKLILAERRKELLYRGIRWMDLRRLNMEPQHAKTLYRHLNNQVFSLPPGDPRYVFPIPNKVIKMSGMEQNPR